MDYAATIPASALASAAGKYTKQYGMVDYYDKLLSGANIDVQDYAYLGINEERLNTDKERLTNKQIHEAAEVAIQHGMVVSLQALKDIFGVRASNPKCGEFVIRVLKLWEDIGAGKVSIQTIADSVEVETGIKYDFETGNAYNLKAK